MELLDDIADVNEAMLGSLLFSIGAMLYVVCLIVMYLFFGMLYFVAEFFIPLAVIGAGWFMIDCGFVDDAPYTTYECHLAPYTVAMIRSFSDAINNN
jgi:hypothetical protein